MLHLYPAVHYLGKMRCQVLHIRVSWRELCQGVVRELIGSCLLIVVGCGSVLSANFSNPKVFNVTGVALCWGMMIASLAFVSQYFAYLCTLLKVMLGF